MCRFFALLVAVVLAASFGPTIPSSDGPPSGLAAHTAVVAAGASEALTDPGPAADRPAYGGNVSPNDTNQLADESNDDGPLQAALPLLLGGLLIGGLVLLRLSRARSKSMA